MRQLLHRDIGVAVGALEVHLSVHGLGKRRGVDGNRSAVGAFGVLVAVAGEAGLVDVGSRRRAGRSRDRGQADDGAKGHER